jgi:hypothetical protein
MLSENSELLSLISRENSKANAEFVGEILEKKPYLMDEVWKVLFELKEPESRRAAWIIDKATEKNPDRILPHLAQLIELFPFFRHDAYKRHSLRMISRIHIPAEYDPDLVNFCFDWLLSPTEAVAVKFHCMNILYEISKRLPEIKRELHDTINIQIMEGTPGFKSIGKKIMKKLSSELR